MFPNRVGRVILDGVIDADHYVSPIWSDSIRDSDAAWNTFSPYCHEAGPKCALYREGDKVTDIEDRFQGVVAKLKEQPITLVAQLSMTPEVLTYSDIKTALFSTLYSPSLSFPAIAELADVLFRGQEQLIGNALAELDRDSVCQAPLPARAYPNEAQLGIMCSDKRYPVCTVPISVGRVY